MADQSKFFRQPVPTTAREWYESNAQFLFEQYEQVQFDQLHAEFINHLPKTPCSVLDIGAGTGRDAAALADLEHFVVAVEPCDEMRRRAQELHRQANIRWEKDTLPKLRKIRQLGFQFDVIVLSAVWMHVAPSERNSAFRRIVSLLKPGGLLYFTLRHGPFEPMKGFWDIPDNDVLALARDHGLLQLEKAHQEDLLRRHGVTWTRMVFRAPGDGTGALPLLRGIILNDKKSSTYKLGLLKVLQHIAQSASGLAHFDDNDDVVIPLGLFALYWLRVYRPLLDENLPQAPGNKVATTGLGFAKQAWAHLEHLSPHDLRVGMKFSGLTARKLHSALVNICDTLVKMPMTYLTYSHGGERIFTPTQKRSHRSPTNVVLAGAYLFSFGEVRISADLWQTVQQYGTWIEPAIVAEWKLLMQGYLTNQERAPVSIEKMEYALRWQDPERTTGISRKRANELINNGSFQYCVWSHKKLNVNNFDIDHCFPYSAWPCGDMWNLLPANRSVNQKQKREKLPKVTALRKSEDLILQWWEKAYLEQSDESRDEFFTQALASLRLTSGQNNDLEEVFASLLLQQQSLRLNQQIPEWEPQL